MISVALIDDNRLVREGIAVLLGQVEDFRVVAVAPGSHTAPLRELRPRVILLDAGLPSPDSLRVAEEITKECPHAGIIVMDAPPESERVVEFVNAGVSGFILKDATLEELAAAIRTVAAGFRVLPPQLTATLFSRMANDSVREGLREPDPVRITPREREVIGHIAEGLSNREIAERLQIAAYTVRSHVRNVMHKLTLHTRLQIAAYVRRDGAG